MTNDLTIKGKTQILFTVHKFTDVGITDLYFRKFLQKDNWQPRLSINHGRSHEQVFSNFANLDQSVFASLPVNMLPIGIKNDKIIPIGIGVSVAAALAYILWGPDGHSKSRSRKRRSKFMN